MNRKAALVLSIVLTIAILWLLLRQVSIAQIILTLRRIPLIYGIAGFALYALAQALRALRFRLLLRGAIPFGALFTITCVHNALVTILPARTGEMSYVYLVKRSGKANVGTGIGTLGLARIFDLLAISMLFFIAGLAATTLPDAVLALRIPMLALVVFLVGCLGSLVVSTHQSVRVVARLLRVLRLDRVRLFQWLAEKVEEALHSLHVVRSWRLVLGAFGCSLLIWVSQFLIAGLIFRGIGLQLPFSVVVLASSITLLLSAVPFHGVLGLGTTEAFWTLSLSTVGVAMTPAIQASFAQHIMLLGYMLAMGAYGAFRLNRAIPSRDTGPAQNKA